MRWSCCAVGGCALVRSLTRWATVIRRVSPPHSRSFSGSCPAKPAPRCISARVPNSSKRYLLLVLAVCVGSGLAHFPTSTMPFQIGALVDGTGLSAPMAGIFGFCEVGALAFAMILIAPWLDRVAPFAVAMAGGLAAALANLGLYAVHAVALQLL